MLPKAPDRLNSWVYERVGPATLNAYGITRSLYRGQSEYQSIEVVENPEHGKLLLLDDELQSASGDEFIYHETLVHPALLCHPNPRRVAILGGGEGGTLREVLRHSSVERVTMIDLDREVVKVCRRLLPEQSDGAFEDPRAELVFGDAKAWIEQSQEALDVVISDLTEPKITEISTSLFSVSFFKTIRRRLGPEGIFSLQASHGNPGQTERHQAIRANLEEVFSQVTTLLAAIPSFGCNWCFATASESLSPALLTPEEVERGLALRGVGGLRFYDDQTHRRLLSLPRYFRREVLSS